MTVPASKPYPWPQGKTSAFCFSVDVDATAPWRWTHRTATPAYLSHLEQRRYGPRVGLPRILDMLDRLGIKGSFYVPGIVAQEDPWILPTLVERGHEVGLHGYFHELVSEVTDDAFTAALEASLSLFEAQVGERPMGFRSPAWELTPHMLAEIARMGLYDSSLMGSDVPYSIAGVAEIPVNWSSDDAIFLKFLGGGGDMGPPLGTDRLEAAWTEESDAARRFGTLFMLTVHDWISGRGARIAMLERLIAPLTADDTVWVTTGAELAKHHLTSGGGMTVQIEMPEAADQHPLRKGI